MIENTFGILAARWRIFRRPILANPENAILFTKATIVLHNYLRTLESSVYCPPGFVDGEDGSGNVVHGSWRDEEQPSGIAAMSHTGGNRLHITFYQIYFHFNFFNLGIQDQLLRSENFSKTILLVLKVNYAGKLIMFVAPNNLFLRFTFFILIFNIESSLQQ